MTEEQKAKRTDDFVKYMVKCFGIRWHSVAEKGKIKFMKQCYYAGYKDGIK